MHKIFFLCQIPYFRPKNCLFFLNLENVIKTFISVEMTFLRLIFVESCFCGKVCVILSNMGDMYLYARFAKKDVGLFETHSFTDPTLMRNGSKAVQEQTDRISSTEPEPPTGSACQGRTSFCWQIMSPSSRTVWAAF